MFFYDPRDEPVGFSTATMESFIRTAATAWAQGCKVRIAYGGQAPAACPTASRSSRASTSTRCFRC